MEDLLSPGFTLQQVNTISNLGLAHVGDGVYELMCRTHLCITGDKTVRTLHRDTVDLVKAPTQAALVQKILPVLTREEQAFFRRGKNAHTHAAPKSATRQEYALATGLETLFGALYLMGRKVRINELFQLMLNEET